MHAVQHEVEHQIEHEEHGHGGGHGKGLADNMNKKIALLISVIALFLAFSETLGKASQTEGISLNIKASDTWNFFQAKTIRQTTLRTSAQAFQVEAGTVTDEREKSALLKQADDWLKTVARYRVGPEREGRPQGIARLGRKIRARARHSSGALPQLRIRIGRLSDRHRAGIRGRHHRHDRAGLGRHRARPHRPHVHRHGAVCATCSA